MMNKLKRITIALVAGMAARRGRNDETAKRRNEAQRHDDTTTRASLPRRRGGISLSRQIGFPFRRLGDWSFRPARSLAAIALVAGMAMSAQAATYCVRPSGSDSNVGTSWGTAVQTIQKAIDLASAGDTIRVTNGTYNAISTANKSIRIESVNGPAVTIINGQGVNRCANLRGSLASDKNTVLAGFTLTNGYSYGSTQHGGGSSGGTLTNCVLSGNKVDRGMSGLVNGGGAAFGVLYNCTLSGNSTPDYGGGAYESKLVNCTVINNTASQGGGLYSMGAYSVSGTVAINCLFSNNSASVRGGGSCQATLWNCLLTGNSVTGGYGNGGGSYQGDLVNCTVSKNKASSGGGVYNSSVDNSIVWGNFLLDGVTEDNYASGETLYRSYFRYSCTTPLPSGTGNKDSAPSFVSASNFRLQAGSPCIDSGLNSYVPSEVTKDLDGSTRIQGSAVDMGCYESIPLVYYTLTVNRGTGISSASGGGNYTSGQVVPISAVVTTPGYSFSNWVRTVGVGTIGTPSSPTTTFTMGAGAATVRADATGNVYTVTYQYNGATGGNTSPSKQVRFGDMYGTLPTPTRTGFDFGGWYLDLACVTTPVTSSTTVSTASNHPIYAKWTAVQYALTVNAGTGVSSVSGGGSYTNGHRATVTAVTMLPGYSFNNWTRPSGVGSFVNANVNPATFTMGAGIATVQANATGNVYTVTFNASGGGTPSPTTKQVTFNSTYGTLATVARTGYTFLSWTNGARVVVTSATNVTTVGNHSLGAQWSNNVYSVAYNGNGHSGGATASSSHTYDVSKALTLC